MEEIINTKSNFMKDVTTSAQEKGGLAGACFTAAGGDIIPSKEKGGLAGGDVIPQHKEGGLGDIIPQDTSWIDDYKKAESAYNDFYKEPVNTVTLYLLYVNKDNELDHCHTDKCVVSEDGYIKRDVILSFIKRYKLRYKLLSLIKYNIDLEPTDIHDFLYEDMTDSDKRFITSEKYLNDIRFDKSIHMFQDMNALFFIFYEEHHKTENNNALTKRVKLSSHCKTKRNNKDIKKNLKINKQIS